VTVEAELLYQSVPPEVVARFMKGGGPEAKAFAGMYSRQPNPPEVVARQQLRL
jgi:hypothetical protein